MKQKRSKAQYLMPYREWMMWSLALAGKKRKRTDSAWITGDVFKVKYSRRLRFLFVAARQLGRLAPMDREGTRAILKRVGCEYYDCA